MTNGPDDQQPGQQPPPPPPPPPPSGGRGLFARNDPDQPAPPPPERVERTPPPPREDPRARQRQEPPPPPQNPDDNPFLLPNERDRMPVYGAAPPLPVVPLALMVLAIVIGAALFFMSRDSKDSGGITAQQASASLVLHMDGLDITENTFRQQTQQGIKKGNIACDKLAGQPADNIAAGLRLGVLKMTVPNQSGVAIKKDQKADDASLLVAAQVVLESCPKVAPAPNAPVNPPPGGNQPAPGGNQSAPGGNPAPVGSPAPAPGGTNPAPVGSPAAAPAGTPRPNTPAAPAATPRP